MKQMKRLLVILLAVCMVLPSISVDAASTLKLRYGGKTVTYKQPVVNVSYNGETISMNKVPGILVDGVAMVPYYDVFKDNVMEIEANYDSDDKMLTMIHKDTTIEFIINEKTAYVNGKAKQLSVAPLSVKNMGNGGSRILVPSRFISETFGFSYTWDDKSSTAIIASTNFDIEYAGTISNYDGPIIPILAQGTTVESDMPGILLDKVVYIPAAQVFSLPSLGVTYTYDEALGTIKLVRDTITLELKLDQKSMLVNGSQKDTDISPLLIKKTATGESYVMLPAEVVVKELGLTYSYSSTKGVSIKLPSDPSDDVTEDEDTTDDEEADERSVAIPRPKDVAKGMITTFDNYENTRLEITLPGDYDDFYEDNSIVINKDAVNTSLTSDNNGQTVINIKTSKIRGFIVTEDKNNIYVTIKAPKDVYKNIVVVDAGHGGTDSGATGKPYNSLVEKTLALKIVQKAKAHFDQNESIKVYYTRLTDTYITLLGRSKLANEVSADLFISVHINSVDYTSAKGTEVHVQSNKNNTSKAGLSSLKFSEISLKHLYDVVGSSKRGTKRKNLSVLRNSTMPGVLLEIGFIKNGYDSKFMSSDANLEKVGNAIYESVTEAFDAYPNVR